ncbi:short-chain fatty acyl-CoA regulator family protein [Paracoccus bogoriensis]|uniref:helix-turn-helix domain-containing protein n=1 Tax=Paracoccus bogoriensis TaxID=242065 RepID=UPI001CA5ED8B|nr:short-chain fatty acyl-CoA regulator family protein [Paracoccus bogoriensis]
MSARKLFLGGRLRALREDRGLTQAEFAQRLGLSPSYLNQIERNQRPATLQVLLAVNRALGVDLQALVEGDDLRHLTELREALAPDGGLPAEDLRRLFADLPRLADRILALARQARAAEARAEALALATGDPAAAQAAAVTPFEEVRDFFYDHRNHFEALDRAAEALAAKIGLGPGVAASPRLAEALNTRHGLTAVTDAALPEGVLRRVDRARLLLAPGLPPHRAAFEMAQILAQRALAAPIQAALAGARLAPEPLALARLGLAQYAAGAVLMPYGAFAAAAEAEAHDIDALGAAFGTSFEQTCHRLATLQRPDRPGLPFFFLRVDRAGNISKRQSAADFQFSRLGGSCPRWRLHAAFDRPGDILTQATEMPDGRRQFWIVRAVIERAARFGPPVREFAIALGCDIAHAGRLIYARGRDLTAPEAFTPIGPACKTCPREGCTQRAFPMLGRPLATDPDERRSTPYSAALG